MLQPSTLNFLKGLKENNNKPWMDENRAAYLNAKEDFEQLVAGIIASFGKKDETIALLTPKECIFRQNRDIRFTKDKSPYKTNMGAYLNMGGKKSNLGGYYFHCEPGDKSFVGGGLWMPPAEDLKKVRQEIDYCYKEFTGIITSKTFKKQFDDLDIKDHTLSREPKGYEKDNPAIKYLKLKSFVALTPLTDSDLKSKDLVKKITTAFEALQPLIMFINRSLHD